MIVGVQGTSSFNDYQIFLRAMGVALSGIKSDDNYIYIYTAGPKNINDMVMEFTNLSDRGLKGRGIKIKMFKLNYQKIFSLTLKREKEMKKIQF